MLSYALERFMISRDVAPDGKIKKFLVIFNNNVRYKFTTKYGQKS